MIQNLAPNVSETIGRFTTGERPHLAAHKTVTLCVIALLSGCVEATSITTRKPVDDYMAKMRADRAQSQNGFRSAMPVDGRAMPIGAPSQGRAQLHLVGGELPPDALFDRGGAQFGAQQNPDVVTNLNGESDFLGFDQGSSGAIDRVPLREYRGPLNLGDPGVSASLWKESRGGNNLFRDYRASQPMDLITIVVNENLTGKKEGTTTVTQESSFSAAIRNFFGLENRDQFTDSADPTQTDSSGADLSNLVKASLSSEFTGDGETERKGTLRGRISAMVAEVLPSGVMRIEGEKIISLNSEEEVMVISGLVRPEDVSSNNEVQSSQLANVRIDYYGNGTIGDAQRGGWMGRVLRRWWPF